MVAFHGIHCLAGLVRVCWEIKNLLLVSMIGRDSSLFSSFFQVKIDMALYNLQMNYSKGFNGVFFPSPRGDMMCQLTASYIPLNSMKFPFHHY